MQDTTVKQENNLLKNVLFVFLVSGASSQALGSFIPFLRENYGLSYDFSGLMISAQSIGNLIAVLITGVLPLYIGRRKSILLTSIWMIVGYIVFASGISIPLILLLACFIIGFAKGGNSNFTNTMMSTLPGEKATKGYNLSHGFYAIGALISPIIMVFFATNFTKIGWRLMAVFLICLVCVQVFVYATMKLPKEAKERNIKSMDKSFLKEKQFWLGSAMLFFYISTEYAIMGWLVTYFQDLGILDANFSQIMSSLLWGVIFIGRMIGASIIGKISRSKLLLIDGIGFLIFFVIFFFSTNQTVVIGCIVGIGLFMATIYPTAFAFGSDNIKGNDLGCSIMVFSGSAGGIITP
ncbi:MAG: MFS transporter, partial [Anaerotignaceae bacterium]